MAAGRVLVSKYPLSGDDSFSFSISLVSDLQPTNVAVIIMYASSFFMFS
jgi:hypothetical protein